MFYLYQSMTFSHVNPEDKAEINITKSVEFCLILQISYK